MNVYGAWAATLRAVALVQFPKLFVHSRIWHTLRNGEKDTFISAFFITEPLITIASATKDNSRATVIAMRHDAS